jgi:predicted transcriptional regulator
MAITFDLPPDLHRAVKEIATANRRSLTQTLLVAVEEYVARNDRRNRVDEISRRIVVEDDELLRRLAQ